MVWSARLKRESETSPAGFLPPPTRNGYERRAGCSLGDHIGRASPLRNRLWCRLAGGLFAADATAAAANASAHTVPNCSAQAPAAKVREMINEMPGFGLGFGAPANPT